MVAKVTMGHGFLGAYEKELTRRIVAVGNNYWMSDGKAGSPGFDGAGDVDDTTFQADSRRTLQAIVLWLTSSASGANILIVGVKPTYPTPSGVGAFGWQFSNALEAAGHTVTWTAVSLGFGAYDPANYDLVCLPDDLGSGELTQAEFDVLIADSTSFLINGENYTYEYGIDASAGPHAVHNETGHKIHFANNGPQTGDDAPGWQYQRPFDCSDFGDPGTGGRDRGIVEHELLRSLHVHYRGPVCERRFNKGRDDRIPSVCA
jgi:hypothetical protein